VRLVARIDRGVELVLPRRGGEAVGRALVADQREWIDHQRARLERRTLELDRPGVIWRLGHAVPLTIYGGPRARILNGSEDHDDAAMTISAPDASAAVRLVERWYRDAARSYAEGRIADWPGAKPQRVRITDTTTRWGSYSTTGTLSMSWRLLLAPEQVFDYVIVHELAHLEHLDHGPEFWAAVTRALPSWRAPHGWLREHGHELHAYDPTIAVQSGLRVA
jgi:predicted metal-dependent hydrolase